MSVEALPLWVTIPGTVLLLIAGMATLTGPLDCYAFATSSPGCMDRR